MRRISLLTVLLLAGCAQLIDLEEREVRDLDASVFDSSILRASDGAGDGGGELSCERYCTLAAERCTAEQGVQLFSEPVPTDPKRCLAVCRNYPKGDLANPTGNTLACRLSLLTRLAPGDVEAQSYCPGAGPGGGAAMGEGPTSACGTNCEGYCKLRQVCPRDPPEAECLRRCAALPDLNTYNANADFGGGADNIQCRLAHLSAAAEYAADFAALNTEMAKDVRDSHCGHSGIKSTIPCDTRMAPPACTDFCRITMTACSGADRVYETNEQCLAFCAALTPGAAMDTSTVGTVRCLREGAYEALQEGTRLCPNAGPGADRCGVGRCDSYCTLVKRGCSAQFDAKFPGGMNECLSTCAALPGGRPSDVLSYSAASTPAGNTLQCRLLSVTRVLAGDIAACAATFGGALPCL